MNQDIHALNRQRPSVIFRVGTEVGTEILTLNKYCSEAFFLDQPSLQNGDQKYLPKSCQRKDNKQANSSGKPDAVEETSDSVSKASSSQANLNRNEKYCCRFCGKSFQWYSHFQAHERIHTGERPFKCDQCGKAFTRSDGLQCHKQTHVRGKCSLSTTNTKHIADSFQYDRSCEGTTKDQNILRADVMCEDTSLLKCFFCGKTFSCPSLHHQHRKLHKDKTVFKCDTCDKLFPKKSALEIHSRMHTGVKPYHCNTCPKAFSIYGNLKRHILIHTGERPYTCSACFRSYNNQSHLQRHIKAKHTTSNSSI